MKKTETADLKQQQVVAMRRELLEGQQVFVQLIQLRAFAVIHNGGRVSPISEHLRNST